MKQIFRALRRVAAVVAVCGIGGVQLASAVTLGMVDDFQDGGVENWLAFVSNIADAGPDGAGDNALEVMATGSGGSFSRLLTHNQNAWTGDFTAAGISRIAMNVRNPNVGEEGFDLSLRLGIAGPGGFGAMGTGDTYLTTELITVPADNAWHEIEFDLTPTDLTNFDGDDPVAALQGVSDFRLIHNPDFAYIGAQVAGSFFLDNISALGPANGLLGDYNNDNVVNAADYTVYQDTFGSGTELDADGDGNGSIGAGDYTVWADNFGNVAVGAGGAVSVPEPTAVAILICCLIPLLPFGTRRRRSPLVARGGR